jgi:unconventional prefoldin RPB5 interactor 1
MSTAGADPMQDLERRRLQLEENATKLRAALKTWKTWEWEYESLKEEISIAQDPSPTQMLEIGRDLGGKHVTEKEVQELLGKGDQPERTANQVVDLISKRVDYVQQNITTLEKQLRAAEKKLAGADILLQPDVENEEGLPLMDIQEELDDEGNVVSSEVFQPGKAAPEIVEALRKSGVKASELRKSKTKEAVAPASSSSAPSTSTNGIIPKALATEPTFSKADSAPDRPASTPSRKSVSFAEDTKPEPQAPKSSGREALQANGYNDDLASFNFTEGTKVIELDEDENEIASYPIIPEGESEEDAALRRQMLQYGLSEVGQVVAEIDLDGRDDGYSDEDEDYDENYDSEISEEEDQYGRSTRPVITDEYRKQMLELEEKLNARMLENVGPQPDVPSLAEHADDVRTLRIRKDDDFETSKEPSSEEPKPAKKGVRFADDLDVSPAPQVVKETAATSPYKPTSTPTMSDVVVERAPSSTEPPAVAPSKPTKVSRFKSSRTSSTQPSPVVLPSPPVPEQVVPQGPSGRTIASTIVEHEVRASDPQAPDEFDPAVINREVQVEYHKLRNKMIQQQGGFKPSEEDLDNPLMEETNGKPKKVSRFRAARLKPEGL